MGKIENIISKHGISDSWNKEQKIKKYVNELLEKREWGKLVSKGFEENSEDIIEDSLIVINKYEQGVKREIVDIGSGGGIVGIPLSIVCDEWEITMVEKSKKKSAFLAEMKSRLELRNTKVINIDMKKVIGEREYDLSVSRAAGKIKDIVPVGLGLVKKGGMYLAIKGSNIDDEVGEAEKAIEENGGRLIEIIAQEGEKEKDTGRVSLVVIEKVM